MHQFLTFREFNNELEFNELLQILDNNQIEYQTEVFRESLNPVTTVWDTARFIIKVSPDKFLEVDKIQHILASKNIENVDSSHYLFDFTDAELYEILIKSEEWSAFDYELSKKILIDRGKQIDNGFLDSLKAVRINDQMKPESIQSNTIVLGYVFTLIGGFIGIFIGWNIISTKKTLPNGDRIYVYDEKDRIQGKRIVITGLIVKAIYITYYVIEEASKMPF